MSSFSPIQLALAAALSGSVLAVFVPTFIRNLEASRFAEPLDGLQRIAGTATVLGAGAPSEVAFPESVPRTPADVPVGERVLDPPGTWDHPTWRMLGFEMEDEHAYSFSFDSEADETAAVFTASAYGDLDGDGELSTFRLSGELRGKASPRLYPVRIEREVE